MTWLMAKEPCSLLQWHLHWHSFAYCTELKAFLRLFNESTVFYVYILFSLSLTYHLAIPTPNSGTLAIPAHDGWLSLVVCN